MRRMSPPVAWIPWRMRSSRSALRAQGDALPREVAAHWNEPGRAAPVNEQVGIGGVWPGAAAVVEPGSQPGADGRGERDVAIAEDDQASVDDVGEPQLSDLFAGQGVEGHEGDGEGDAELLITRGSGNYSDTGGRSSG